jgi:hypothetical protein
VILSLLIAVGLAAGHFTVAVIQLVSSHDGTHPTDPR